jgi:hypothetical protein
MRTASLIKWAILPERWRTAMFFNLAPLSANTIVFAQVNGMRPPALIQGPWPQSVSALDGG